ncbi:MAG: hypothetical protein RLY71_967 [Pseudomonadota bacterium]|jgi:hypothetical protein
MSFGRILLGDNQFLGINHASPDKAQALGDRFARPDAILEVIDWAYQAGIRDFMFTTHDRLKPVFAEIVRSRLFPGMQYIPCLPYAHKYADSLTDGGIKAVLTDHLGGCSKTQLLAGIGRLAVGDFAAVMQLLLEVELLMTRGLNVRGVFLQNVIFDLIMGLRGHGLLARFHRHVTERFHATPGYITMNHSMSQKVLCDEVGLQQPWICANFNVAGFRMNPGQAEVEASFANKRSKNIAMSIFASGALGAIAAVEYVRDFPGLDSILFGSSRRQNIETNIALISGARATAVVA